jgi:long-chain fatty acid transport protein
MRGRFRRELTSAAALLVGAALLPSQSWAAGFAVREQSAEGQGASFAGVAAGTNGLSSMFWNPATISQHNSQGYISESDVGLVIPYSRAKDGSSASLPPVFSPDSGNIGDVGIPTASYDVYGLTDQITLGLAISSPFGLSTNSDTWVGSQHGDESSIFTININPNIAYKFNDMLTVAVGIQGEYMDVKLTSDSPLGGEVFDARADDIGVGFTAGVLFEPMDGTSIGVGFRSSIDHSLDGNGRLGPLRANISARFNSPELVTLGVRQRIDENLTLLGGVEWANWSRFKELRIKGFPGDLVTPERWDDSWFFSLGAEYAWSDALTFRGGVAYEDSGVPNATRTPRVPDNNRYWLSVGASYKVNDWLMANLGYSHVFMENGDINLPVTPTFPPFPPLPQLSASFHQNIDIVAASATIDW